MICKGGIKHYWSNFRFMKSVADGLKDVQHNRLFSMDEVFDSVDRIIAEAENHTLDAVFCPDLNSLQQCVFLSADGKERLYASRI